MYAFGGQKTGGAIIGASAIIGTNKVVGFTNEIWFEYPGQGKIQLVSSTVHSVAINNCNICCIMN